MLVFEVLFIVGLVIPILIIGGIVYLIFKLRAGASIRLSYQGALRFYFYLMLLISIGLVALGGVSTLLKVGFGEVVGREFSYGNVYEEHTPIVPTSRPDRPSNNLLTEKVEFAMRTSLINGVSLTAIGFFLALIHFLGRRWVETKDQGSDLLKRLYLMAGLAIFAIITIVSLSTGIPEALRYILLDINPGEESPGEPLSIAIVALPVWLFYLVATIRTTKLLSNTDS